MKKKKPELTEAKAKVNVEAEVSGQNLQKDALTMNEMREQPFGTDKKWEPLCYVNATPDDNYVLRILEAHLSNCEAGKWQGSNEKLINEMNKWQDDRAELLRKAIAKLRE